MTSCMIAWNSNALMAQELHIPSKGVVFVDGKWIRIRDLPSYRESLGNHGLMQL